MKLRLSILILLTHSILWAQSRKRIYEIQGMTDHSHFIDSVVTTSGIVTATFDQLKPYPSAEHVGNLTGFYLQETNGDNNPLSSDGIYIYSNISVTKGDSIVLTGKVGEYYGLTQLSNISSLTIISSNNKLPQYTVINLPLDSVEEFESFESMLVSFNQPLYVTENRNIITYGEIKLSVNGVLTQPTQVIDVNDVNSDGNSTNGLSNIQVVLDFENRNDASYLILDDARTGYKQTPVPYLDPDNTIRAGTIATNLQGVLSYSYSEYRLHPTEKPVFTYLSKEPIKPIPGVDLLIASFNVKNYFNGDGIGGGFPTSRGAKSELEFIQQTSKIVSALVEINADVFGLIEIENDSNNGFSALKTLTDSLNNRLGAKEYNFLETGIIKGENGEYDEIKNAFIYKNATIELVENYAILDNSFDSDYHDEKNRPVLAQTFRQKTNGEEITLLICHLKSKGSKCNDLEDIDLGDGQGNCNRTRVAASSVISDWIESKPTNSVDPDYLILGDLNSYAQEDPIDLLRSGGYIDLTKGDFSYVYNGAFGSLDYALANYSLKTQVMDSYTWHINSIESPPLLYNNSLYGSSDHDPIVVGLNLKSTVNSIGNKNINSTFQVYPNPATDQLYFNSFGSGSLRGLFGDETLTFNNVKGINIERIPPGIYYLKFDSGDSFKVVIR